MESKAVPSRRFLIPAEQIFRNDDDPSLRERRSSDRQMYQLSTLKATPAEKPEKWWYSRGYIPHHDGKILIQHVTVHLADSLPQSAIERIELSLRDIPEEKRVVERRKRLHAWVDAGHGSCTLRNSEAAEIVQNSFLYFHEIRYFLHAWVIMPNHFHVLFEPIENWRLARIVTSWKRFTARRIRDYLSRAKVQESNTGLPDDRSRDSSSGGGRDICRSEDRRSREFSTPGDGNAEKCGKQRAEPFWHREFWDRYIRDEEHYYDTIEYIHNNPVKAGLVKKPEDWPWSSARQGGRTG